MLGNTKATGSHSSSYKNKTCFITSYITRALPGLSLGSDIYYNTYPHKYEEGSVCSPAFQEKKNPWSITELIVLPKSHIQELKTTFSTNPDLIPGLLFFIHLLCGLMLNAKADAHKITSSLLSPFKECSPWTRPATNKSSIPSFLLNFLLQLS